jgi:hypothetical protein
MPYNIADKDFRTKGDITEHCRAILHRTPHGNLVDDSDFRFLIELFMNHEKWASKSGSGVVAITTQMTPHGTPCFAMILKNGHQEDISFPHVIKLIPTNRSASRLPQGLLDYRAAARKAVEFQIYEFRDQALAVPSSCQVTGEVVTRENCAVDHVAPLSFDRLLFQFTSLFDLKPLEVEVGTLEGTVAVFASKEIESSWMEYHHTHCDLRLLTSKGNLQSKPERVDWSSLL